MYTRTGNYRGIDYHARVSEKGWVADLSKAGQFITEIEGRFWPGDRLPPHDLATSTIEGGISNEFELAESGQSPWGSALS